VKAKGRRTSDSVERRGLKKPARPKSRTKRDFYLSFLFQLSLAYFGFQKRKKKTIWHSPWLQRPPSLQAGNQEETEQENDTGWLFAWAIFRSLCLLTFRSSRRLVFFSSFSLSIGFPTQSRGRSHQSLTTLQQRRNLWNPPCHSTWPHFWEAAVSFQISRK